MATRNLDSILAARKAQVTQARSQDLIGLRRDGVVDSDDDDDEGCPATTSAVAGGSTASAALDLGRAANQIASRETDVRKRTLALLVDSKLNADQLKPLLRPLLLRFADDAERCRDLAVALFSRWQQAVDASEVGGALPFLVPVMVERLGSDTGTEPSEEVRAALVTLMRDVLLKCRALLRPYLRECGAIALGCCRDQHPEVIKGLCELLEVVAVEVLMPMVKANGDGPKQVKPFSTRLLAAVLPHCRHRHAAVRTCVLRALEELLLCGAGQFVETLTGWRLKNNVPINEFYGKGEARLNYLADLSRDRSVVVRRQLHKTVSRWMSEMQAEDLYEQEVRIAPYLVSGLCDDDEETAELARREVERLGAEHIELHIKDYKERIEYGYADEAAATAAITLPPPAPFKRRPSLGARERILQHFRCLIHPICAELDTWTSVERLQSAKLLEMLLVYVEGKATEFAHQLLPALAKGVDGENPELAELVGRAARQFAQFTQVEEYMPLLVSSAGDDALNTLSKRVQHVTLLRPLLEGMRPAAAAHALRKYVVPMLADESQCGTQHTALRQVMRTLLHVVLPARLEAAAAELRAARELFEGALAPPPPLGIDLLMAVLIHCASDVALLPKTTVTRLGAGLEDVSVTYDESAWARAAEIAGALAEPLLAPLSDADGGGGSEGGGAWAVWRSTLAVRLQAEGHAYPEFAESALQLLERLAPAAAAEPRAVLRPAATFVPAPVAGKAPTPSAVKAPRVLAIAECDDFSSDDDSDEVPTNAREKAAAGASRVSPAGGAAEVAHGAPRAVEMGATETAKATGMKKVAIAEDDEDDEPATAPEKAKVGSMRKVMIAEDDEDDEPAAAPEKAKVGSMRKVMIAEDDEDDEPAAATGGSMRKVLIEDEDSDDDSPATASNEAAAAQFDDFADELD